MTVRPVRELPRSAWGGARREPYAAKDVREFMRLGYEVAAVEVAGREAKNVAAALEHYVRSRGIKGIRAVQRSGTAYLVREDGDG